jgi:hypothetical protein
MELQFALWTLVLLVALALVFDFLNATVDSIEDVSDVIQGVVLKHA